MAHYQVCFTRIGGQGSSDGWQAVNASNELPPEAVASFTRFQNGNVYPPVFDAEDAAGQIVTELQSDGNYIFFTRIKYGLKDQTGRPAMFAHAYVFPISDFAQRPREVLSVSDGNFAFDIEQTRACPVELVRDVLPSLPELLREMDLSEESYTTLVQCVYFVMDSKAKSPLHIICDCRPKTIRYFMTCIYAAIPFEFRKKLTYSTYENQNGTPKQIIFNRKAPSSNGFYLNIQTGENNVLTDVLLKRWEKYEFIKVAPHNPAGNIDAYFHALEDKLALFGSTGATSLELYKIAHDLIMDDRNGSQELSPEMLCKRLNEFLSIPVSHPFIDRQVEIILGGIIESKTILNDVLSEKLCRKLEQTQNPDLIDTGHLYNTEKISRMEVEEGGKYLYAAYQNRNSESFLQIRKLLDRDAKGREILNHLYTGLIAKELPADKAHIIAFYKETLQLFDRGEIQESLYALCTAYLKSIVKDTADPRVLMQRVKELTQMVLPDRPDRVSDIKRSVIRAYWEHFAYEQFQFDVGADYYSDVMTAESTKARRVAELLETYRSFAARNTERFSRQVNELFTNKSQVFSTSDRIMLVRRLQQTCVDNRTIYGDKELDVWLVLAFLRRYENKNAVKFLIDNDIKGMKCFEETYQRSRVLEDPETLQLFVESLEQYMQRKTERYKIAADALLVIKKQEKRNRQDEKRQLKEQRQAQKEESARKFPFNLRGLFRKNTPGDERDEAWDEGEEPDTDDQEKEADRDIDSEV